MSSIHYRFRSSSEYETITFDGPSITVHELREAIMESNRMAKSPSHTLEITNAQTKEVYQLDSFMVPKNSSVVVKRVPVQRHEAVTAATSGLSKEEEELTEMALAKLIQAPNLSNVEAPEDEKIKAMHKQATDVFDPRQYSTIKRAPPNYQCFRCNGKGHYLRDCPTQGDPRYNNSQYHRGTVPSGIPRAYFLMRMKQEEQLLLKLREMQPEHSRFSPVVGSDVVDHSKIPSELQCPMCKKLFTDVVVTPCCGFSYCDECIRNHLIDNDLTCVCKETTSPDNLIANKSLRISVSNFRNQKKDMKSVPPSPVANMPTTSGSPHKSNDAAIVAQLASSEPVAVSQPPQIPPEAKPESSQALTNGVIGLEGPADTDAIDNSPKKLLQDSQERNNSPLAVPNGNGQIAASQHVVLPASNAQVVTSQVGPVTQIHGSIASQVLPHPFAGNVAGPALYGNVQPPLRPGIILPQQQRHIVPHPHPQPVHAPPHPIGINIPPGATVFKRLAMVPVGPRVAPNPMALPPHHAPARMMGAVNVRPPHMVEQIRARTDHVSKTHEKHRGNEAASPMPLTEAEFNSIKQQFRKRTTNPFSTRRRHRSTSADESSGREQTKGRERSLSASRSRSRTPPSDGRSKRHARSKDEGSYSPSHKKKYDSADDSSQERRRKDKSKRRHRDSSLGSGTSSKGEPSSAPKSRSSRSEKKQKTRELPEHIKREIDEFEFDNELEFDEELRNLRKKQKRKSGEMSTPERSPSPPIDFICETATDAIAMPVHRSPTVPDVEKPMTGESSALREGDVKDKPSDSLTEGTSGNMVEKSADQKVDGAPELLSPNGGSVPQVSADGKPKKRTKIIKKKVVRRVKVTRKKAKVGPDGQPLTSPDAPTSETTTPTEPPKTESDTAKTPDTPTTPVESAAPVVSETTAQDKKEDPAIDTAEEANVSVAEAPAETSNCTAASECDQTKSENETSILDADQSISENDASLIEVDQSKPAHDASVVEIEPPREAEEVPPEDQLPENSRWETASGKPKSGRVKSKSESHDGRSSPSPKKPKTLNLPGVSPSKKKSRKEALEKSAEKAAALKAAKAEGTKPMSKEKLAALKQMHCAKAKAEKSKIGAISDAVIAKKEAEKRSLIEKSKKIALAAAEKASKAEGRESMSAQELEERKKKVEKYILLKKQRAKERLLAERQKAKKLEAEGGEIPPKLKTKSRRTDESDHGAPTGEEQQHQRRPEASVSYKPADAKLKSISEITKKRLKQSEGGVEGTKKHSSNEVEDDGSDVLKSKVTSIKTVIGGAEKRRVIKTSVSEEREYPEVYPEDVHVRRVIKVGDENRKKSLVSKVEKSEKSGRISDHDKRRHREDEREQLRDASLRDRDEPMDRERYERRVRLREEETMRREMKEKIRSQREMEKEMREKDEQKLKSLEKEKLESLERERLANKEREKLERKLKRERQLREDMMREKEEKLLEEEKINERRKREAAMMMEKKRHDKRKVQAEGSEEHNSDDHKNNNKRTKKDKNKPGYIIQIIDSEKSDSESDSTDADDREKKKKKKKKKSKDKKKRRKKTEENKSDEKAETEESSDEEKEEEEKKRKKRKKEDSEASSGGDDDDRKKKKRKKHKKKHKKHKKLKRTKKKSKKSKKSKKEKESESESDTEQQTQSGEDSGDDESAATGSGKDEDGDDGGKSSSSSDGESAASSASEKKKEESPPSKAAYSEPSSSKAGESRSKKTSPGARGDNDLSAKGSRESTASRSELRSKEKSGTPKSERPMERSEERSSVRRSDERSNERSSGKPSDERLNLSNERLNDRTTERRPTDRPSERRSDEKSNERPSDRLSTERARSERRSKEQSNERTSERLSTERSNERSPKRSSERPVERPSERPVERPSERPVERPSERPVERPSERPVERPSERLSRDSTDHHRNDREKGGSSKASKSTASKSRDKEARNEQEPVEKSRQERRSDIKTELKPDSRLDSKSESRANMKVESKTESTSRSEIKPEFNAKDKSQSRREARSSRSRKEQSRNNQESRKSDDRRVERRKDSTRGDAKKDRVPSSSSHAAVKRNDTIDELELDYNDEDLELEDDVYNDLGFADDEQTNPDASDENRRTKKRSEDFEDGEILDEDLYAASGRESKKSKKYDDEGSTDDTETEETEEEEEDEDEEELVPDEPSDAEETNEHNTSSIPKINVIDTSAIESAVDDEIDKLDIEEEEGAEEEEEDEGLEEDGEDEEVEEEEEVAGSPPAKVKRTRSSSDAADSRPPRVLRKR